MSNQYKYICTLSSQKHIVTYAKSVTLRLYWGGFLRSAKMQVTLIQNSDEIYEYKVDK